MEAHGNSRKKLLVALKPSLTPVCCRACLGWKRIRRQHNSLPHRLWTHPIEWWSARSNGPIRMTRCGFVVLQFCAQNRCAYERDRVATSIRGNGSTKASEVDQ